MLLHRCPSPACQCSDGLPSQLRPGARQNPAVNGQTYDSEGLN